MTKTIHFRCPICHQPLARNDQSLEDDNGHNYDISNEGYVNLLLSSRKKSKNPGDSKEMLISRRSFLDQGHYQPLAEKVADILVESDLANPSILDIGCGEGYYLRVIDRVAKSGLDLWGIDISKPGISMAAKSIKNGHFAVASAYDLPFLDNEFGLALSIFSPLDYSECHRVLSSDGALVAVGPGPDHLKEVAEMIYEKRVPHEGSGSPPQDYFSESSTDRLTYTINLKGQEQIANLVQMTPYYWQMNLETAKRFGEIQELNVTADFIINALRPIA